MELNQTALKLQLENFFRSVGYKGDITITPEKDGYIIKHTAFEEPFWGFYPGNITERFTVLTVNTTFKPHEKIDFEATYKEALVLFVGTFQPEMYSIFREPEFQRIMLSDGNHYLSGEIFYDNRCMKCGLGRQKLDKPLFTSKILDIDRLIHVYTY